MSVILLNSRLNASGIRLLFLGGAPTCRHNFSASEHDEFAAHLYRFRREYRKLVNVLESPVSGSNGA